MSLKTQIIRFSSKNIINSWGGGVFFWVAFPLMSFWHLAPPRPPTLLQLVEHSVSCRSRNARASPRISRSRWQPPYVGATRLVRFMSFVAVSEPRARSLVKGIKSQGFAISLFMPVTRTRFRVCGLWCVLRNLNARCPLERALFHQRHGRGLLMLFNSWGLKIIALYWLGFWLCVSVLEWHISFKMRLLEACMQSGTRANMISDLAAIKPRKLLQF